MSNNLSKQLCELCRIPPKCVNCGQTVSDENPCPKHCNKQKYPDLTKPENFVKLYKLLNKTNEKEFLQRLIGRLSYEAGWFTDELKQSIREAEWVYEA